MSSSSFFHKIAPNKNILRSAHVTQQRETKTYNFLVCNTSIIPRCDGDFFCF